MIVFSFKEGEEVFALNNGYSRLNFLEMLHVQKNRTDAPTLVDVANDFVGKKENRQQLFGKLFRGRYPKQVPYFIKVNTNGKLETV